MKNIYICVLLLLLSVVSATSALGAPKLALLVNEGFQIDEYQIPKILFEKAGIQVTVVGPFLGNVQPGRKYLGQGHAEATATYDSIKLEDFDAIVLIGGSGAWKDFFPNDAIHRLIAKAFETNKLIGLICAATGVLGTVQNLDGKAVPIAKGRKVTGYYQVEGLLTQLGKVQYDPGVKNRPHVVTDANLVTGRDPQSATLFAQTIINKLKGTVK